MSKNSGSSENMVVRRKTVDAGDQERADYYLADESLDKEKSSYYSQDKNLAIGKTKWKGSLAKEKSLSLSDEVEKEVLKEISYGTRKGVRLRGASIDSQKQRLFHDVCVSPAKSISIAGLVLDETGVIESYDKAVDRFVAYIESRHGGHRQRGVAGDYSHGDRAVIHTGKMLIASMQHYTARPVKDGEEFLVDPQLHNHLLVMNTTLANDGKWRGLFHESLAGDTSLTEVFNQFLAEELQSAGYKIRQTKNGFELADISDEDINTFSKRTKQAEKKLKEKGQVIGSGDVHKQALKMRKGKIPDLTLEDLKGTWAPQAEGMFVTKHDRPVEPIGFGTAEEELEHAIDHLSERCVHFHGSNIKQNVFEHVQKFSVEELESAIAAHPNLINMDDALRKYPGLSSASAMTRDRYTTPELIKTELEILRTWKSGLNKVAPLIESVELSELMKPRGFNHAGKEIKLNENQAIAVKNALESPHQFQIIKGLAGVGKTTAMAELFAQVEEQGGDVELFGFAATHEAKSELEKSLNLRSRTVASLVMNGAEGRVWIVDESGMNSNKEWKQTLDKAEEQGVRIIMVGDPGQNSSVNAGSPLSAVIRKFPETVQRMDKIIRQQNPKQLQAVELISSGKGIDAVKLLVSEQKVQEIDDRRRRARAIAKSFAERSQKDRDNTVLVSGTNLERRAITKEVRKKLSEKGILGDSAEIRNLVSRNLSEAQAKLARNYRLGDYVKFYNAPRSSHFKTGHLYKVEKIQGDILHLKTTGGRDYIVNPKKFGGTIEALEESSLNIAVGDRVKFTATVKAKDWYNGTQLNITAVSGEWIKGVDKNGKEFKIDTTHPVGIDHDWVGTSYGRQGKTARYAIISLTNDPTSSQESSTVSISRHTHDIEIFTESVEELHKWIKRSNRQPNVLDELGDDDRMIEALEKAIALHQEHGGKAQDYVERELQLLEIQLKLEEIRTYEKTLSKVEPNVSTSTREASTVGRTSNGRDSEDISRDALSLHRIEGSNIGDSRRDHRKDARSERGRESTSQSRDSSQRIDNSYRLRSAGKRSNRPGDERSPETVRNDRESESNNHTTERENPRIDGIATRLIELATIQKLSNPIAELRSQLEELRQIKVEVEQERIAIASLMEQISSGAPAKSKPVKLQAFWEPSYNGVEKPENIEPKHWEEMQKSCIHPDLIKLNIESIYGTPVVQRLLEEDFKDRGSGQYVLTDMQRILSNYDCLKDGGWWGNAGTDAQSLLTDKPVPSLNGVFKGDRPRMFVDKPLLKFRKKIDTKNLEKEARLQREDSRLFTEYGIKAALEGVAIAGLINTGMNPNNIIKYKINKYENPKGIDRPVFLANIPDRLAQKIYQKHGVTPSEEELKKGFWHIVHKHNLPIILIEGFKKALASLSQGEIAIGTPGVALYRSKEKINGKEFKLDKRELLKDIAVFATPGRQITFAYDQDPAEKTKTIWNVRRDLVRSAELLSESGCDVVVAKWRPEQGKGVDDLISISGATEYLKALNNAKSWEGEARIWYKSRYTIFSNIAKTELGDMANQQKIDRFVYHLAVNSGDRLDGVRVLRFSDGFKSMGIDYVSQIVKSDVPTFNHRLDRGASREDAKQQPKEIIKETEI